MDQDVLANLDIGKKTVRRVSSVLWSFLTVRTGLTCSVDTHTIHIFGWYINPAHCNEPTGSFQTAERRTGRGGWFRAIMLERHSSWTQELRKQFQIISELRTEIKTLQADNLKLYEKVRYMQSYREDSGSRPVTQLDPLPAPSSGRLDDMSKYQARYEEAMNPFEAFRGRVSHCNMLIWGIVQQFQPQEATRAYQALNPVERGVLTLTRSVLGNRRARTFFICYALALHLLVLYTTYECTGSTDLQKRPNHHVWGGTVFLRVLLSYSV